MNRRQSLEKGILSPSGFLTPSQSPSIQHSPRLQPSPSQSPFQQQDVLLVTNNNQHFINTFNTTQEQDRKTGTPNRRSSLNHISPNAGNVYRPSPTQSPAGIVNELNTTLVGSNNISLNKKGKRTPNAGQYGVSSSSNACSPKAAKKAMALVGSPSPIASPSASPQPSAVIQQFPMMNANNSIVFMQQPATSHRASIIQTSNTQQSNFIATSSSSTSNAKHNKAPQQILPKPANSSSNSGTSCVTSSSLASQSLITSTTSTKQIVTQSKMAIVQQQQAHNQHFQSPPHQSPQIITTSQPGSESPSPQPQQIQTQGGSILLPTGAQPLLLNQMPVLVHQNTAQGVQLILRQPPQTPQLAAPSLVIQNRSQMQQNQPQAGQFVRILNTNGMQLATAAAPAFIVSSQANIIQQNLQSIKTPTNNSSQINQLSGMQQNQQQTSRQHQQIINSHILGQSVAQIQNLQLNGNLTQIQMPNGQILQQLPAQFSQNIGSFNQIQPIGSQIAAITNATFQSPPSNSQNDMVPTVVSSTLNPIQFTTNQQNPITMTQGAQIISPGTTPQPQIIQSDSILSSPPSITFNSQPQTAVIVTGDKQIHEISSPPPFSIIQQSTGNAEMINLDVTQHQTSQPQVNTVTKPARKPKKSKKKQALEEQQQQLLLQQQQQQQQQIHMQNQMQQNFTNQSSNIQQATNEDNSSMLSPNRNNSQAPTGKLDLANVIKLCGISEDDDFMDTDEPMIETIENQQMEQTQTIQIPASSSNSDNNTDIMITIPSGSSDQPPFTLTFPSSSIDNADGTIIHHQNTSTDDGHKISDNVPFMIRFDGDGQGVNQPFTISVPNLNDEMTVEDIKQQQQQQQQEDGNANNNSNSITCVPSFVNSVLNSSVTPTIQSQINEIQNQLMALPPVTSTVTTKTTNVKAPRQKKQTTKKSKKQQEKTIEVPTQIGNIQISQIDGNTMKNNMIGSKNINNQIQIMPILEKNNQSTQNGPLMEKQRLQVPIMQQTISHHESNQHDSSNKQQQHQQQNSQGSHSNSGPSQVNINVQQNQLINVTNNLQMQVIANPQQQHHNNATPAGPPPSSNAHQNNNQNTSITTQPTINAQNIIGNIINAQQGQSGGNIIIQGTSSFNQQQPANIQVNIQNQTIANNIITTAHPSVTQNITNNTQQNQHQQQPTAQSILSQLTGNLVLSLSEDGRLILHHDPNIPQDEQSQKILEIVLTGALGNVSLINEPLKTPAQNQQQTHQHIIGANGKIQQVSTVQNKNVIITSQAQPQQQQQQQQQQIYTNMVQQTQTVPSGQIIQNTTQPIQIQQSRIVDNNQQKPQAVVLPTPNIIKFVELPKIQPNQQLFSLNTITNEITLLNPNQTTAALSPMERLLIVPSGINAQQLAQCLSQGQIHFNNIGQAPTTDPNKVQQQLQIQQQIQMQQQMTFKTTNVQKINQNIKKEPVEAKPKKARGKKAKLLEEQMKAANEMIKKEPIQSPPPMKMITTQAQVAIMDTKVIKTTTVTSSNVTSTTNSGAKNTITISPNPTMIVNPTKANITKTVQANVNVSKANKNSITVIPTSTLLPNNVTTTASSKIVKGNKNQQVKSSMTTQLSPIIASNQQQQQQTPPPPLVSVNQAPIPRVQTIQLTPQKQQSLKNVQMQIQQLSAKLQNKSLLSTLTSDFDLNNPAFNKPLPALTNINSMTDNDIYEALQRLFVEQQKILATGKIIPTIPAAVSPVTNSNQTSIRAMQNASQSLFVNNQNIVAPISSTTSSGASLYSGGNSQKVPSPIQVNSPIVKQETPCSSSTSSQPPPLVVSTPIQMQIKTEILSSPNSNVTPLPPPILTNVNPPPATGSIVISPKYPPTSVKITIDPQQKEQKVPVDSKLDIVPVQTNDITIDPSAIIKQQQIAAVELNQKKKVTRSSLFERQICVDQEGCTKPDVKSDFSSKEDAIKRLIRYHCMFEEIKDENDPKEDFEFEEQAKLFLASFQAMKEKYQYLILKQSQQQAPTSELMMLDRLQVADLKDEIVSMQMEINSALFEQQQQQQQQQTESQITIKTEPICPSTLIKTQSSVQHVQNTNIQQQGQQAHITQNPPPPTSRQHFIPSMQEPSQILKAKQEQKLFENIKSERIKIEIPDIPKENSRKTFGMVPNSSNLQNTQLPSPKSPILPSTTTAMPNQQSKGLSKFDKLKNEQSNVNQSNITQPIAQAQQQSTLKLINELKDELDDFDIESEIRSNFIMKKCEPNQQSSAPSPTAVNASTSTSSKKAPKSVALAKEKEKERECSPFSDYLNSVKMELIPPKNKTNEAIKTETHDGAYDEWLSIQKELNLHLDAGCSSNTKRKEISGSNKSLKIQSTKALESDLSDIFENHTSPKSVEKQLDDLFSSTSKSNDLLSAPSPPELNELFQVESTSTMSEKTVENRLEALFGGPEDDSAKSSQQDLVETRLEQLFQSGSVNPNDESALDNASFLYKNSDLTYDEMIQKQVQMSRIEPVVSNTSNANKRQWSGNSCDIFSSPNSGMIFPTSPTTSKRACTEPSVPFDNKWIDDSFDFGSDINLTSESTSDDMTKHRNWNGIDHSMDASQYQLQDSDTSNIHANHNIQQTQSHMGTLIEQQQQQQQQSSNVDHLMDTSQMPPINFGDDNDDISRQVQNAIDSILNLQSSDPLHYQLDSSFLELNAITSSSPNSPVSHHHQQASTNNITQQNQHHSQFQLHHHQQDHHMTSNIFNNAASQKISSNIPKRKYPRTDDIGDCLIGGSNLDDSPSALSLTLTDSHNDTSSANSVGEFVNNLLNCDEKSITTS